MPANRKTEWRIACPQCHSHKSTVTDSRIVSTKGTRRRRRCENGHLFTTVEVDADQFNSLLAIEAVLQRIVADAKEYFAKRT